MYNYVKILSIYIAGEGIVWGLGLVAYLDLELKKEKKLVQSFKKFDIDK